MKKFGPGLLVMAAFVGPGTVTTASVAGANYGFALLWAVLFSIVATLVLQEMAARLGLVARKGLAETLATTFKSRVFRVLAITLIISAITFGNAAFEVGNIAGASMGLEVLTGFSARIWSLVVGAISAGLLAVSFYRALERLLVGLVVLMSFMFLMTMFIVQPSFTDILAGMFIPRMPSGSLLTVVALVGTTVVPYNLFLHSSSVKEKWHKAVPLGQALTESRIDTVVSILLGGLITLAVVTTAATTFFTSGVEIVGAETMARQLEPLLGPAAKYFFAVGLLSAGITSAITAPLAAAYTMSGLLGWGMNMNDRRFRATWMMILFIGTVLAASGIRPVPAIIFAQAANGVLLPVTAVFLLVVMNRKDLLGAHRNGVLANCLGGLVVIVASGLGLFQLARVFGLVEI